ncbi:phosphoethanolamine transferase [Shewanella surugensis]|uniref:Phosphoethanolamine--lipid A transferase n=1 Tax=Shewanella surugensis TaxID=212020 RepID=A0ABT0L979_9GAMM|nr:phosphoethanolamine--lipid A transferase [Shewanella surugensis]MCL1124261.1 phosphoethanolamine--lipid A transferase [Shewanella surugensis]
MFDNVRSISSNKFVLLLSFYYLVIFNIPFFEAVKTGIDNQGDVNWLFVLSIPLLLLMLLNVLFSLFTIKYITKPFFILLTIISSLVFYSSVKYGIIFDTNMIQNIVETTQSEASTYFNTSSIVYFFLTGGIPCFLIYKVNIVYQSFFKEMLIKLGCLFFFLLGIVAIVAVFYQNYAAFGRNNDLLKRLIIPTYVVGSTIKYVNEHYFTQPIPYQALGTDAVVSPHQGKKPNLIVMVLGETARAKNYEYYGYDRPTNAYTKEMGLITFQNMTSCGTATAVSVPCMFSHFDRSDYQLRKAQSQDTILDVLTYVSIDVQWFDNDSGCKGVCNKVNHMMITKENSPKECTTQSCFDEALLTQLDIALAKAKKKNTLIVLHLMGSHGPTYYLRYPKAFRQFLPDCQRSDIQNCNQQELVNTYDNTILYTDYIISKVIQKLKIYNQSFDTGMIYMSDHGESLGEKGLYLHGAPYSIAPTEQIHIPFLSWFSDAFYQKNRLDKTCLQALSQKGTFSHDNLFDSLLGIFNVKTQEYHQKQDVFSQCRL